MPRINTTRLGNFGNLYNPNDYITSPNYSYGIPSSITRTIPAGSINNTTNPNDSNFIPTNRNFWQQTGITPWDLAGTGVQFIGNLASSLINQGAINRLKFTPIHTMTVAEAPVKFNTKYNIEPQLDNLRESLGSVEREVTNNSASSRNRIGRITSSRFRDNLDNTKTTLTGQNWTNFTQNTSDSLVQAYNRGQRRLSDATSLAYFLARDIDAAKIFTGKENPTFNDIWNHAYNSFGIPGRRQATKLGGRSSLIRK